MKTTNFSLFIVFSLFFSCNNSFDMNEKNIQSKEYDVSKMQEMSDSELYNKYPELSFMSLDDKEKIIADLKNVFNKENESDNDLKNTLLDHKINGDIINFIVSVDDYFIKSFVVTRVFTKAEQACLDAYSIEMSQIRRSFAINCFLATPIGAYITAKNDMQAAYDKRELCMRNA